MLFSVYLAGSTGTTDAMISDTVLERTGSGDGYQAHAGRLTLASSLGLLTGALTGGALAELTSPRTTYLITGPLVLAAMVILTRFREPVLHRAADRIRLRDQLQLVWQAVGRARRVRAVVAFLVVNSALMTIFWEFHQLWLVNQTASLALYGPFVAALFVADGAGGWLAGRIAARRPVAVCAAAGVLLGGGALLIGDPPAGLSVVTIAAMLGASSLAAIVMSNLMHHRVSSNVRAGVFSGISSLSWVLFIPAALAFGGLTGSHGLPTASWLITGMALAVAAAVVWLLARRAGQH